MFDRCLSPPYTIYPYTCTHRIGAMAMNETERQESIVDNEEREEYPLKVQYCGECSMPFEYCEYSGRLEQCKKWWLSNSDACLETLNIDGAVDEKKHQKRGGKGLTKPVKESSSTAKKTSRVSLQRAPRGKNKSVTVVKGLGAFGIDLKVAAKFFASRFACGSSVTAIDEIVIQGDVKDDLLDVIPEKWPQVDEELIDDLGDQKR